MPNQPGREILPIPDRAPVGPTMYSATDPDAQYDPIRPLRPPDERVHAG